MIIEKLPNKILKYVNNSHYTVDSVGQSESEIIFFDEFVLKISERDYESENEYSMLCWLQNKLPVPKVIECEEEQGKIYLLMSKVNGKMACDDNLLYEPNKLIDSLCDGLQLLWNVDISNCPSDYSLNMKLILAENRVNSNLCNLDDAEPSTYGNNGFKNPEELLLWLKRNKPSEKLVLSHGDYCLSNIFINNNRISGFIDLGRCGKSDIYQDIALCYRSLKHNYDGKTDNATIKNYCNELFEKLGVEPDWDKIRYYILLDELF